MTNRDVAGILHFLTPQQMAEEIVRLDAALAKAPLKWKGYALLGDPARTGGYVMEHSAAPPDPELGAEFIIRPAAAKDREGNRQVGESRQTDGGLIQPETMAIRIGFLNAAGLDALEAQLRVLREENFPDTCGVDVLGTDKPVTEAMVAAARNKLQLAGAAFLSDFTIRQVLESAAGAQQ